VGYADMRLWAEDKLGHEREGCWNSSHELPDSPMSLVRLNRANRRETSVRGAKISTETFGALMCGAELFKLDP
jgi:hypothetical protein